MEFVSLSRLSGSLELAKRTDGRSYDDVLTKTKTKMSMGYHVVLTMVLRVHAFGPWLLIRLNCLSSEAMIIGFSGERGAPLLRKYGNPSMRENLVL